ncbi:uncharacterized protein LOC117609293 [Osmia lignaria lignaria]|uniref:uncharacterized protein LOC117609293 n=1 Tax=Osmia lignaria lignaria TaxID=1437193 RepID=UPI00402B2D0D
MQLGKIEASLNTCRYITRLSWNRNEEEEEEASAAAAVQYIRLIKRWRNYAENSLTCKRFSNGNKGIAGILNCVQNPEICVQIHSIGLVDLTSRNIEASSDYRYKKPDMPLFSRDHDFRDPRHLQMRLGLHAESTSGVLTYACTEHSPYGHPACLPSTSFAISRTHD